MTVRYVLGLGADLQLPERSLRVDAWLLGQPEDALADDVAHHFVGAAGNTHARSSEDDLAPGVGAPLAAVGSQLGAEHVGNEVSDALQQLGRRQLGDAELRTGQLADVDLGEGPLVGVAGDAGPDDQLGEVLANEGILGHAEVADHLDQSRHRPAAGAGHATRADRRPLVHQGRQGDRPAAVDVAEAVVVGDPNLVEEHLVEASLRRSSGAVDGSPRPVPSCRR